MFIPFITIVMQLFASIFMKFFSFPLGDLGFNLGTLMIFLILLRFAFRVILPELMLPTLALGRNVKTIGRFASNVNNVVGTSIAKHHLRKLEQKEVKERMERRANYVRLKYGE